MHDYVLVKIKNYQVTVKITCSRGLIRAVTGVFFKFGVEVRVELSIVNALYRLRITDQLFKSYAFTRVVRSQSTLQRLLRRQIKKKKPLYLHEGHSNTG
jgi:hypothetical protein